MEKLINSLFFWNCILYLLGFIFLLSSIIINITRKKKKINYTKKTEGIVVENKLITDRWRETDGSDTYSNSYHAIVNYSVNGKTYTSMSNISGGEPLHQQELGYLL